MIHFKPVHEGWEHDGIFYCEEQTAPVLAAILCQTPDCAYDVKIRLERADDGEIWLDEYGVSCYNKCLHVPKMEIFLSRFGLQPGRYTIKYAQFTS